MLTNRRSMLGSQPASPHPSRQVHMTLPSATPGNFPHSATSTHFPPSATSITFPQSATTASFPSTIHEAPLATPLLSPAPPARRFRPQPSILTSTTSSLPGYRITRILGTVHTSASTAPHKKHESSGNFFVRSSEKNAAHAEEIDIVSLIQSTRDTAVERLEKEAVGRGANAVIGMSFTESEMLGQVVSSVFATAVVVEKVESADWIREPEGQPPNVFEGEE